MLKKRNDYSRLLIFALVMYAIAATLVIKFSNDYRHLRYNDSYYNNLVNVYYRGCFDGVEYEEGPPTTGFNTNSPAFFCKRMKGKRDKMMERYVKELFEGKKDDL